MALLGLWVFARILKGLCFAWLPSRFLISCLAYLLWVASLHTVAYLTTESVSLGPSLLSTNITPTQAYPYASSHQTYN